VTPEPQHAEQPLLTALRRLLSKEEYNGWTRTITAGGATWSQRRQRGEAQVHPQRAVQWAERAPTVIA
jgi:hypothetical protein